MNIFAKKNKRKRTVNVQSLIKTKRTVNVQSLSSSLFFYLGFPLTTMTVKMIRFQSNKLPGSIYQKK